MLEKELKSRVLVSIAISPVILLVALPNINAPLYIGFVYIFFILLTSVILFEIFRMFESKYFYIPKFKKMLFIVFSIGSVVVLSSASLISASSESFIVDLGSIFTVFLSAFVAMVFLNLVISSLNTLKHNYLIVDSIFSTLSLYIVILLGSMLSLKLIDIENNTFFLAFSMGVGWFSEAGGLIIGRLIGRVKLSFLASPNKTLEGTIGMFVFGIAGGLIFKLITELIGYQSHIFIKSYWEALVISILVVVFCIFGDIIESLIKRFFDYKDSSNILQPLGGVFDVFDGVMFASFGVIMYYFAFVSVN